MGDFLQFVREAARQARIVYERQMIFARANQRRAWRFGRAVLPDYYPS